LLGNRVSRDQLNSDWGNAQSKHYLPREAGRRAAWNGGERERKGDGGNKDQKVKRPGSIEGEQWANGSVIKTAGWL